MNLEKNFAVNLCPQRKKKSPPTIQTIVICLYTRNIGSFLEYFIRWFGVGRVGSKDYQKKRIIIKTKNKKYRRPNFLLIMQLTTN